MKEININRYVCAESNVFLKSGFARLKREYKLIHSDFPKNKLVLL